MHSEHHSWVIMPIIGLLVGVYLAITLIIAIGMFPFYLYQQLLGEREVWE
jgi:uncharacterized membrane protein